MEMRRTETPNVFLDLTHLDAEFIRNRFPRVYSTCLNHGVDITAKPVPVHPAAHYSMGGVRTDLDGRTNVPGLYAAGEVACTGVHGANRLASNSLLEGVVFGARAGRTMREWKQAAAQEVSALEPMSVPSVDERTVRDIAWEYCGILRTGDGLTTAIHELSETSMVSCATAARPHFELRNLHTLALLIARCALAREESRGGHYRLDFPETRAEFQKHSYIDKSNDVTFA
jgi:L-aspartate oxidase